MNFKKYRILYTSVEGCGGVGMIVLVGSWIGNSVILSGTLSSVADIVVRTISMSLYLGKALARVCHRYDDSTAKSAESHLDFT